MLHEYNVDERIKILLKKNYAHSQANNSNVNIQHVCDLLFLHTYSRII